MQIKKRVITLKDGEEVDEKVFEGIEDNRTVCSAKVVNGLISEIEGEDKCKEKLKEFIEENK